MSSKSSAWLKKECLWRRECCMSLHTLTAAGTDMMFTPWCIHSFHNAARPAAGLSGPPGSGILGVSACWYCGEEKEKSGQGVDMVNPDERCGHDDSYLAGGGVLMSHTYPKERPVVIWITCCTFRHAETSPCFSKLCYQCTWTPLPSANNTEETYCPLVLSNICQNILPMKNLTTTLAVLFGILANTVGCKALNQGCETI